MPIWSPDVVSQHLSKSDKRGWLTRWPPWSFANAIWHSALLCLHWWALVTLISYAIVFSFTLIFANGWFTACDGFYGASACLAESYETINHYHYYIWNVTSAREWDFTGQMVWWHCAFAQLGGNTAENVCAKVSTTSKLLEGVVKAFGCAVKVRNSEKLRTTTTAFQSHSQVWSLNAKRNESEQMI